VELVLKALKNADDFADIIKHYQSPIRRYVARLGCRDTNDADDLLQDIFLKVYINLNEYDADLKFSSWLYRIAHNETVSFFRKKKVRPNILNSEELQQLIKNIAGDTDVAESLYKEEEVHMVREALAKLDFSYREVLALRFLEEKSYTEISDILQIPTGTVGTLINRGKKELKNILESNNFKKYG